MPFFRNILLTSLTLIPAAALAHGPMPTPLIGVPIPPVPGLLDGPDPIVVDKQKAIALGKALFWDINVGSDGMACASCHFSAGADSRTKNQINPGQKSSHASGQTFDVLGSGSGGPNHTFTLHDFPFHQYDDPLHKTNGSGLIRSTDDVAASAGTFSGQFAGASRFSGSADLCGRSVEPVFHVNQVGTRRVEPRNTPTVINAVFNHRNFWDGRANNIFNGSSIWGDRDPNAGVWVKVNAETVAKRRLHLENSALASQAVGPGLSDLEMSCAQRTWPDIGRKLLLRPPLQYQKVHHEDSVFAPLGLSLSTAGNLRAGLNTTYKTLITQAYNPKYWSYTRLGPFGGRAGQTPYNQMEANFALFFGLAIQLYESTLVSDQAPIDLSRRDENLVPIDLSPAALNGLDNFVLNHCNLCHAGPTLTTAAIQANAGLVTPTPGKTYGPSHSPIPFGPDALGPYAAAKAAGIGRYATVVTRDRTRTGGNRLMDFGFANTGVGDPNADPGVGGLDDFGHSLSFTSQYVQYLLDNPAAILDPQVGQVRSCDFIFPLALNTDATAAHVFTAPDGLIADGSKEGLLRDQNCSPANSAYIPTAAAAAANLSGQKMAYSNQGVFKIPSLRNIELTGPYMHNGGMATLEQVVEFYGRGGNFDSLHKHNGTTIASLANFSPSEIADLVEFMKSLTDERVRYERAPFDHPEIAIPHGHEGDESAVTAGNPINAGFAKDDYLVIPAVGAQGSVQPIPRFDQRLAP
ncbi:cytochrome c peroxidase [Methylococcus sp. EFPC2]|uniref:cytochrome c peroxidase n=1 Tax=Methylococcus sp. EFPC2 TaxID=2812648 RepID=UPI001968535C|nr:cytochrome c peroxidase [Methylococcus sp. EFPC2]QSA97031.1 cytochrome C peroxidase [Methylococcus sp. EFPC2]